MHTGPSEAELACELLRLRKDKAKHDGLQSQLRDAEAQVKRLSPTAVLSLHAYCERHLADPALERKVHPA